MELYMLNRQNGRMILESVESGPLIWPSIEENGVNRPKKYSELSATEALQADYDIKATNIIFQGLPPEVYALVSNHKLANELWEIIQLLMQGTSLMKQERESKIPLLLVANSTDDQFSLSNSSKFNQTPLKISDHEVSSYQSPQKVMMPIDAIKSQDVVFGLLSSLTRFHYLYPAKKTRPNPRQQAYHAMPSSEQSNVVAVQILNSSAQQDDLILSVIEQLKT
ncbi:hypothetical protein Tco_1449659 [Tanacetum coccineum]